MRCPKCGNMIPDNVSFCTNCGYENKASVKPKKKNKTSTAAYILLAIVLVAAIIFLLILFADQLGLSFISSSSTTKETNRITTDEINEPVKESFELTAHPSASTVPTPTITPDPLPDVDRVVKGYLDAFEEDINNGEYQNLYRVVETGSSMEKIQKDFIEESAKEGHYETLLNYQTTSREKVNESTYHITTVETIEVWQNIEPNHQKMTQRCVYIVRQQTDGSWKMYGFAKNVEFLDRQDL